MQIARVTKIKKNVTAHYRFLLKNAARNANVLIKEKAPMGVGFKSDVYTRPKILLTRFKLIQGNTSPNPNDSHAITSIIAVNVIKY